MMHSLTILGMLVLSITANVEAQAQQLDLLNFATKDYIAPSLKSLQLSTLSATTDGKPIINAQPWHPSTSCQPLLETIATGRTHIHDVVFTTVRHWILVATCTPLARVRIQHLVPGERMSVLVHWHGTGGTTITRQELDNMSPTYAALRNTLVIAPTSAIGPANREWHLTAGSDVMADMWLMDDLVTCLGKSDKVDPAKIFIAGMSAGGVHVSYLTMLRPHYLAAAVSFSGGIPRLPMPAQSASVPNASTAAGVNVQSADHPYARLMPRLTPVLALAGGPTDIVTVRFPVTTDRFHRLIWTQHAVLSQTAPGVKKPTLVRCDHTQGHKPWMGPEAVAPFLMASARVFGFGEDADPMAGMVLGEAGTCRVIGDASAAGVNVDEVKAVVKQMAEAQGVGIGEMAGKETAGSAAAAGGGAKSSGVAEVAQQSLLVAGAMVVAAASTCQSFASEPDCLSTAAGKQADPMSGSGAQMPRRSRRCNGRTVTLVNRGNERAAVTLRDSSKCLRAGSKRTS
ncbi:hypothetical protein BCR44DRAFT_1487895 [Catenaria anguillulae PL171]|uniref:Alpha/Beta hydrolase protein n=1 Tax=Catenaria anguillulae PL171 TaxID=765915 RepID=A0A1Y2H9M9_9FUNG|nr:hypothetical protein BCR44DRAFT_1487895 [Catenaria anguillulae PL171]